MALLILACAALPLAGCPLQDAMIARADGEPSPREEPAPPPGDEITHVEVPENTGGGTPGAGGGSGVEEGKAPVDENAGNSAGREPPGDSDAVLCTASFPMTLRDFPKKHPDFGPSQTTNGKNVEAKSELENGRPVDANPPSDEINQDDSFDEWFKDEPGVNMTFDRVIHLDMWSTGGHLGGRDFYFLDGVGFGNEGEAHNFGFTASFELPFTYRMGAFFSFDASDDVWISIDDSIVVSHSVRDGVNGTTVRLDDEAARLRMRPGSKHKLKVFYAERDGRSSVFRLNTALDVPCEPTLQ